MIDKLAWFCIKNKKILGARSKGQTVYYLPGGKRDPGESDQDALIREIHEELSVKLIRETLRHIHTFQGQAHGKPEGVLVQLSCYAGDFQGEIKASAEIEEVSWLSFAERDQCSATMQMVLDWLKDKNLL
jgi:8-oxo-dGTP diphosphatase